MDLASRFAEILRNTNQRLSDELPSDFIERTIKVKGANYSFDETPYMRQIVNHWSPFDPIKDISVIASSQIGKSYAIVNGGMIWMIKNQPGNTCLMVGTPDLVSKSVDKFEEVIQDTEVKKLIGSQTIRVRNQKSGDTNSKKEFPKGYIIFWSANNPKNIAQLDLRYMLLDDLDMMPASSAITGDLIALIESRTNSYENVYKIFKISTPLLKGTSNIEAQFLLGNQCYYNIPCPCCHKPIVLHFEKQIDEKNKAGLHWELNNWGSVIDNSIVYICQECAGAWKHKQKKQAMIDGNWVPTAIPQYDYKASYSVGGMYSGMMSWRRLVHRYIDANPLGKPRDERKYQTFLNTVLGQTYEPPSDSLKATDLMRNQQPYEIGIIPEKLSMEYGCGRIILITCGADLNGKMIGHLPGVTEDDVRLDYEIVAHAENGATFSIEHGSIGSFERGLDVNIDRYKWTYEFNKANSVWGVFMDVICKKYIIDGADYQLPISMVCLDSSYFTNFAYSFVDLANANTSFEGLIRAVKGKKETDFVLDKRDFKPVALAQERADLYLVEVSEYKDNIAAYMKLKVERGQAMPPNFMNFPLPAKYICPILERAHIDRDISYVVPQSYGTVNYYEHFESESRQEVSDKNGTWKFRWAKKNSSVANHMFDCRVYNLAAIEIFLHVVRRARKLPELTWQDWCTVVKALRKVN